MRGALLLSVTLCACGSSDTRGDRCPDGETLVDGACRPSSSGCGSAELTLVDGTCVPVGVPPDGCAEGFSWMEGICEPILPSEPCPPGTMALPGETSCRPIMECPTEPWGGIDGGASPQWVDGSYGGNDSDGTQTRPWTTIADAIAAAAPDSVIGIAAGTYTDNLTISGRPIHLRGTCPEQVTLVGVTTPDGYPTILITGPATSGTSITGLSITGPSSGVGASGGDSILFDRVRFHDAGPIGLEVVDYLGPTSVILRDSLVESIEDRGLLALGAALVVERSVVRDGIDDGAGPAGIHATANEDTMAIANLEVSRSFIDNNVGSGVFVVGSNAAVDGSVLAGTRPGAEGRGYGLALQDDVEVGTRAEVVLSRSVVSGNTTAGVNNLASTLRIETSTITDTRAPVESGVAVNDDGRGVNSQDGAMGGRGAVQMTDSTIASSQSLGLFATGSDLALERVWIRDSGTGTGEGGRGVNLQPSVVGPDVTIATMRHCLVSSSEQFGVFVAESELVLDQSEVRDVVPVGELGFGDAVTAVLPSGAVTITGSRLANGARAGLSLFSGQGTISDSVLSCHAFDIATQDVGDGPASLDDGGGNLCGCGEELGACKATSTELEPPSPL